MNTLNHLVHPDTSTHQRTELLVEVDFKWLMAGQGCWIDPSRLRIDRAYARDCLRSALKSGCEPLRRCAKTLENALLVAGLV